ncbi:Truncated hemoglobin YjbI [Candidatus Electronema halotolerans]
MKKKRMGLVLCLTAAGLALNAAAVFAQKQGQVSATQPNYSPSQATMNAPPNPYEVDKQLANIWNVPYARYNHAYLKQKYQFYPSNIAFEDKGVPFEVPSVMTCGGCHPQQFEDWKGSMHEQAFRDPIYLGELILGIKDVGEGIRNQCEGCHTAAATVSGLGPKRGEELDMSKLTDLAKAGVSCDVCHSIRTHTHWDTPSHEPENGSYVLSPGYKDKNGNNVRTKYGPFPNYDGCGGGFHECIESPLHLRGELCGGCHQVFHYEEHFPIEHTYNEWKKGIYSIKGIQCQDCHMVDIPTFIRSADTFQKPKRSEYRHFFNGANFTMYLLDKLRAEKMGDAKLAANAQLKYDMAVARLQAAAEMEIEPIYDETGLLGKIKVRIWNKRCGHALPTSLTNVREMWLEVTATDEDGREVLKSGFIKPDGELDGNTYMFNSEGADINMKFTADPWKLVSFTRHDIIPPKGYKDVYYSSLTKLHNDPHEHTLTLHAKLRFRVAGQKLAEKIFANMPKGFDLEEIYGLKEVPNPLPVVDMIDKTVTFKTKGKPSVAPVQERADILPQGPAAAAFYETIGGEVAVSKAVDLFYDKVMADPRVNYFFEGVDMATQRRMQKGFMNFALGSGQSYTGRALKAVHARLVEEKGLNDTHFDIILQHFREALEELGVKPEIVNIAVKVANSVREDVLGRR